eukprot:14106.XXX_142676_122793_1 [CDS] Oithona nana genome sequencing.
MRRDLINSEIANLRDLLPLPSSTRQRLSQLQLMALVLVYVRKSNYFDQVVCKTTLDSPFSLTGISIDSLIVNLASWLSIIVSTSSLTALNGFLMMATQTGKLLYISDNAAEYLGHSMEDLLIHGDSVYDIIDKQDHASIQSELMRGLQPETSANIIDNGNEKRIFLCRMNVSRNARRQMRFGDQKVVLIEGRFSGVLPLCSRNEPVFLSWCTPIAMPETRECVVQGATNIFTSIHSMDFKITSIDSNGEYYLGYKKFDLKGTSWYNLLHPECIKEVQSKHRLITQSENDRSCILLLRLLKQDGSYIWVHTVLQVKENLEHSQSPVIVCTNQVLNDREATVMKANSWLYHYYMVQSRLQYSLAYGGQSPTSLAAFYPMQNSAGFPAAHNFDGHMLHASFMTSASQAGGVSYPGYAGYTPPPGAYNLHASHAYASGSSQNLDQRSSDSPLDFSAAANQYGNNNSAWNDEMRNYEDQKVVGFTDVVNPSNGLDRTSSPEYRSESSSTSPLQMTLLDGGGGGGSAEVTTLSRPAFHRSNGTSSNTKKLANFSSDVNANTISNGSTFTSSSTESSRRVPEIAATENRENGGVSISHQHDLKKWSEMCKMETRSAVENSNGDSNNNHSSNSDSSSQVLPDMDFSN